MRITEFLKWSDLWRLVFSIILLYFVWTNSHWSVALSITFIFITMESVTLYVRIAIETSKMLTKSIELLAGKPND